MSCTYCEKSASKLATRSLCECCLKHIERCDVAAEKFLPVVWEEDAFRKIECDICLEQYQENKKKQHRKVCKPRVIFRCSLCDEDYLTQESLGTHLIDHQVPYEKRELYCQETRLTYKQFRCVLCNDQRSFRETYYWQHIHEDHDGYYLKCLKCGESFRSKKRKADHDQNPCNSQDQIIPPQSDELELIEVVENVNINEHLLQEEQNVPSEKDFEANQADEPISLDSDSDVEIILDCNQVDDSARKNISQKAAVPGKTLQPQATSKCTECTKVFATPRLLSVHMQYCHEPSKCDTCGLSFQTRNQVKYHERKAHARKKYQCQKCMLKCRSKASLGRHMLGFHHMKEEQSDDSDNGEKQAAHEVNVSLNAKTDCPVCKEKFNDHNLVAEHVEKIHNRALCTICRVIFANADQLEVHTCSICPYCNKGCYNLGSLTLHIEVRHKKATCEFCKMSFHGKRNLSRHKMMTHSESQLKASKYVKEKFYTSKSKRVLAYFRCKLCSRKLHSPASAASHVKQHCTERNDEECHEQSRLKVSTTVFRVFAKNSSKIKKSNEKLSFRTSRRDYTDRVFPYKLRQRKSQMHKSQSNLETIDESEQEPEHDTKIPVRNTQPGGLGSSNDYRKSTLQPTVGNSSQAIASTNEELSQTHELKTQISIKKPKVQQPDSQTQRDTGKLLIPLRKEPIHSSFEECPHCNKMIKSTSMSRHLHEVHNTASKCTICGLHFQNRRQCRYHELMCHTDPKYQCPHCPEKFHVKAVYQRHVDKHKDDFSCGLCSRTFISAKRLVSHVQCAHPEAKTEAESD